MGQGLPDGAIMVMETKLDSVGLGVLLLIWNYSPGWGGIGLGCKNL